MATRSIVSEIEVPTDPARTFALLVTPSAIRAWWQASRVIVLAQAGGTWAATWGADEDRPDDLTVATIEVYDPPRRLVLGDYRYDARSGPLPFELDMRVEFEVLPSPKGALLRVTQSGFPGDSIADEFYAGCVKGWGDTLGTLRAHARGLTGR
jgi:uncharacterized protein YndB with AHSA1/START domain